MLAKYFLSDCGMNEITKELGQELNRDIIEELKAIKARLEAVKNGPSSNYAEFLQLNKTKLELNKQRIESLGLKLIHGGKS